MKSLTRRVQEPHPAGLAMCRAMRGSWCAGGGRLKRARLRTAVDCLAAVDCLQGLECGGCPPPPYACLLSEQVTAGQLLMGARSVPVAWYCPSGVGM